VTTIEKRVDAKPSMGSILSEGVSERSAALPGRGSHTSCAAPHRPSNVALATATSFAPIRSKAHLAGLPHRLRQESAKSFNEQRRKIQSFLANALHELKAERRRLASPALPSSIFAPTRGGPCSISRSPLPANFIDGGTNVLERARAAAGRESPRPVRRREPKGDRPSPGTPNCPYLINALGIGLRDWFAGCAADTPPPRQPLMGIAERSVKGIGADDRFSASPSARALWRLNPPDLY